MYARRLDVSSFRSIFCRSPRPWRKLEIPSLTYQPEIENLSILADAPGEFQVELRTEASKRADDDLRLYASIGLNLQEDEDGVLLSVEQGPDNVHLQLTPSDISVLRQALDLCDQRITTDSAAKRADDQWPTDSAGY